MQFNYLLFKGPLSFLTTRNLFYAYVLISCLHLQYFSHLITGSEKAAVLPMSNTENNLSCAINSCEVRHRLAYGTTEIAKENYKNVFTTGD